MAAHGSMHVASANKSSTTGIPHKDFKRARAKEEQRHAEARRVIRMRQDNAHIILQEIDAHVAKFRAAFARQLIEDEKRECILHNLRKKGLVKWLHRVHEMGHTIWDGYIDTHGRIHLIHGKNEPPQDEPLPGSLPDIPVLDLVNATPASSRYLILRLGEKISDIDFVNESLLLDDASTSCFDDNH